MATDVVRVFTKTNQYYKLISNNVYNTLFSNISVTSYGKDYLAKSTKLYGRTLLWAVKQITKGLNIARKDIRNYSKEKLHTRICQDILVSAQGMVKSFEECNFENVELAKKN